MKRSRYIWLALLTVLAGVAILQMMRSSREQRHLLMLRDSVTVLRNHVDTCSTQLEARKAEMSAYAARVDSLHERVRELESLPNRGVPADSYDIYMAAFDGYNSGAAGWNRPAGALRSTLQNCRTLAERHNLLVDSLRDLLTEG